VMATPFLGRGGDLEYRGIIPYERYEVPAARERRIHPGDIPGKSLAGPAWASVYTVSPTSARLAHLDRTLPSGRRGHRFESCSVYQMALTPMVEHVPHLLSYTPARSTLQSGSNARWRLPGARS